MSLLTQLLTELSTNMRIGNPVMEMYLDLRDTHVESTGEMLYCTSFTMVRRLSHAPE